MLCINSYFNFAEAFKFINKSNSTAKAVGVEANVPWTSAACAFLLPLMHSKKMFDLENFRKGDEVHIFDGKY